MQALLDSRRSGFFFVAYSLAGIYIATAVLMAGMALLAAVDLLRLRRIPPMHLLSAALVFVLAGHPDPAGCALLKWKPTIFLWLVSTLAIGSVWFHGTPLAQRLLQPLIAHSEALPRVIWLRLNWCGSLLRRAGRTQPVGCLPPQRARLGQLQILRTDRGLRAVPRWRRRLAGIAPGSAGGAGLVKAPAATAGALSTVAATAAATHLEVRDESAAHVGHAGAARGTSA